MIMTREYRMLIVFNQTENPPTYGAAGFHIINTKINKPMGSIQNVEIYYESDIPFPFSYASSIP
jgi:hypothetical protein